MKNYPLLTTRQKAMLVSGKNFWRTHGFKEEGVKSIRFSDGPAGLRFQFESKSDSMGLNKSVPATCFPAHSALACSFNRDLARGVGKRIGEEGAHFGTDVILAPAVNIKRSPLCGRNFEYFSEDPYLSGILGGEYICGVQSSGVGACIKHYCANNKELGRTVSDSVVDERTLREIYLTSFEIAVKSAKPNAVMSAYNRLNGVFCNENKRLITDILRGEWGFEGVVVSDWGGTHDRVSAIKAGADLEMPGCKFSVDEIDFAVKRGNLSEEELSLCADRIIKLSQEQTVKADCDFNEHSDYAVKCAEECAVLLKNDGALPLKQGEKIALFGEFAKNPVYQGGGSSHVCPTEITRLLDCAAQDLRFCGYARGFKGEKKDGRLLKKAVKLARGTDVLIVSVGLSAGDAEGLDRESVTLPESQTELLKALRATGKKIIAVLSCGGAVETDWDAGVNALLFAGLSGQGGAAAVWNILVGKANPSGRLAETFPLKIEDSPAAEYFNKDPYYTVYGEGMNVGYRYFRAKNKKYPFGFGLSYTEFEYSDLVINGTGAQFTLTNVGGKDGAEAVQMYIEYPRAANSRFQLKGFSKIYLKAGESRRIEIPFDEYSFRSFDVSSGKWLVVSGEYKIFVGSSSENLPLCAVTEKSGDCEFLPEADVSGLMPAPYPFETDKNGRITVNAHTPIAAIVNSRAVLVRLFVRLMLRFAKKHPTVYGTMRYAHVRTCAQFVKFDSARAEGLYDFFNGKYFKGIWKMLFGRRQKSE